MKTSELRIGNYVRYGGNILHVTEVSSISNRLCLGFLNMVVDIDECDEVELAPEILQEWCGFEEKYNHSEDGRERNWLQHNEKSWLTFYEGYIHVDEDTIAHIHYLHQLQNLFQALAGKELTVNTP